MKNDRLFQMLYLLLEKQTLSAPELAKTLEVSVRTVYRDVETLSMAGVPIFAKAGKGGGISLIQEYAFNKALLSDDEQNQILFAIQSLSATDLGVDSLLAKLGGLFQKPNANWISVDFSRWGYGQLDKVRFDQLKDAILNKQALSIRYSGASGQTRQRQIKPFQLVFKDKSWYLHAFCLQAEDYRLFKISRISEVTATGQTFDDDFSNAPAIAFDTPNNPPTYPVTLLFSKDAAFRVFDEFHPSMVHVQEDESFLVNTALPNEDWVVHYIYSYGHLAKVLAPAELREKMLLYAKKIYEHYKT